MCHVRVKVETNRLGDRYTLRDIHKLICHHLSPNQFTTFLTIYVNSRNRNARSVKF